MQKKSLKKLHPAEFNEETWSFNVIYDKSVVNEMAILFVI